MFALSDSAWIMLLTRDYFATFTERTIIDPKAGVQVVNTLGQENREGVDELVARAVRSGGQPDPNPVQDESFMYARTFADPDGHIWEAIHMDVEAAKAAQRASSEASRG